MVPLHVVRIPIRPNAVMRRAPNLMAHADASIEVGPERLPVTGELIDRATWERLWPRFVAVYPGYADYLARCAPRRPRMFRLRPHPAQLSNRQ